MHEWHSNASVFEKPARPPVGFPRNPPRTGSTSPVKSASLSAQSARATLVQSLRFEPFLHFQLQLDHPFCVRIDSHRRVPLYVIGGRDCWLEVGSEPPVPLKHGDVVFMPHGGTHRLFSDPKAPPSSFEDLLGHRLRSGDSAHGMQPECNDKICGCFYWNVDLDFHPLVAALPPMLHLRSADAPSWLPFIADLVRWIANAQAGGKGVGLTEMTRVLLQHLVLDWLQRTDVAVCASGLPAANHHDPRLLPALGAIHSWPAHPWTPESLASLCHMSRTTFSTRFQAQMSHSPMRYLASWRVYLAARLLRERRLSLDQVAERVGYSTGAILARAYRRVIGVSPRHGDHS